MAKTAFLWPICPEFVIRPIYEEDRNLHFVDIATLVPQIPKDSFFIRATKELERNMTHEIVVVGSKRTSGAPYFQLPDEIANLVPKIREAWIELIKSTVSIV